jgi:hypothetical protein
LDDFVETVLIPEYTRGDRRARNPAYLKEAAALARARRAGDRAQARKARDRMRNLPSGDLHDPDFRRLRYVRYCDDHLLGFTGPKAEAEEIKQRLAQFLREDLKLELSQDKTLITHARSDRARFLGYEISVGHDDRQRTASGQRAVNGAVSLHVPKSVIKAKSAPYPKRGQPARRSQVINLRRLRHRQDLWGRIPRPRPVLPACRRCPTTTPAPLGHAVLDAQDPGSKAPLHGDQDRSQTPGEDHDTVRASNVLPSHRRPRKGQQAASRTIRWHSTQQAQDSSHQ